MKPLLIILGIEILIVFASLVIAQEYTFEDFLISFIILNVVAIVTIGSIALIIYGMRN